MVKRITTFGAIAVVLAALLSIWPLSAQTTRGCNLPPEFPCPEARIVSFEAKPASIKPGQSVELSWAAENPGAMSVTPTVGPVFARGATRLTPAATTTYTLSVGGGPGGAVLTKTVTVTVEGTTPIAPSAAPAVASPTVVPRTADGKPLLQGVWNMFGAMGRGGRGRGFPPGAGPGRGGAPGSPGPGARGGAPGGPPPGGRGAQPSTPLAPGQLPNVPTLKPGMESYRVVQNPDEVRSDCVVGSVPPSIGPYSFQIIQNSEYVVILYEYMHLFRVIPLDGGPHQPGPASWLGDSVGHWDGDTLVIDTVNFNLESTVGRGGGDRYQPFKHSDALHMVERIRRPEFNTLEWETTLEDPKVFEGPWRNTGRYALHPEFKRVEEYMCNENVKNYDYLVDPTKEIKLKP